MYKINLTCVFSLLRRTVYIGFTPFRIFRYLSQKCIPNQNQYGFCTKQEVVVFHGKIAWKPYHTKKNSRLCSIYYTINWNYIICAAIVSWKTWLPLLILNNFFLFLISKFWRPQTTQCGPPDPSAATVLGLRDAALQMWFVRLFLWKLSFWAHISSHYLVEIALKFLVFLGDWRKYQMFSWSSFMIWFFLRQVSLFRRITSTVGGLEFNCLNPRMCLLL